ncbi:hypothetical protein AcW1_006030 [Taiwanofungus camphoratus]|nr:hypothetical protein AcW2_004789 [Antrodia cinnamomea]KAI0934535.1 hypothetical protein AcV5_006348 [Antrodia cinnamomea]KAI0950174.1 hypothetical protein AcV7_008721 [Antrodia cinnamomea]KAI0957733.1 hypothetical protein AcW1_006030 [Antrodia cinnamomea]
MVSAQHERPGVARPVIHTRTARQLREAPRSEATPRQSRRVSAGLPASRACVAVPPRYVPHIAIHTSFFWLLAKFTSVEVLRLHSIKFGSLAELGRLVCALLNVSQLHFENVTWNSSQLNAMAFERCKSHMRISALFMAISTSPLPELVDLLFTITPVSHLWQIHLYVNLRGHVELMSVGRLWHTADMSLQEVFLDMHGLKAILSEELVRTCLSLAHNTSLQSLMLVFNDSSDQTKFG